MKTLTTFLTALALGTTLSLAEDKPAGDKPDKPRRNPAEAFKKLDKDSDGKLSKEEWKESPMAKRDATKAEEAFGKKDKDSDGSLNLEEFKARGPRKQKN